MPGIVGQLLVLIAFVACGLSLLAYFLSARDGMRTSDWTRIGRAAWTTMTIATVAASAILLILILTHQFQYAYVYQYTSRDLPGTYLFSSFWAGQEGSFLLWILFMAVIGLVLGRTARSFEGPVMAVVAFCQLFLLSMVVGLKFGALPVGSSPFALLPERFPEAPVFQQQPDFVPADGSGLNDLLQNYWMAIHPPTLFVGFAAMVVPFAFAVAGLWKRRYTEWVKPALPWTLFATVVLGIGIAMGGYWAYVTLSFGGYWAWDPVENSSLVPWLIGIAAIHTMIAQRKSASNHRAALLLTVLAYVFVIYSTFLTRSGILGDISVHSFVDLGLANQLLLWILGIGLISGGLFIYRYRELPSPPRQANLMSREFLIFSGATVLCATAAVIILGTSAPILGRIFRSNPSAVPIEFYNKWTLPLSVGLVLLLGLGQLFWWHKMSVERVNRVLFGPLALSVVSTTAVLALTPFVAQTVSPAIAGDTLPVTEAAVLGLGSFWSAYGHSVLMTLLLFGAFFALFGNGMVLWRVARGNVRMAGGALSHIGFGLMILGIIASSGFSTPLVRDSGVQMGDSRDNFVLHRGETRDVGDYRVTYAGREPAAQGRPAYVLNFEHSSGRSFTLRPVVYRSEKDQWIQHPDLKLYFEKDIYAAVAPSAMFEPENTSTRGGQITLARNDSIVVGDGAFSIRFAAFDTNVPTDLLPPGTQIAVAAVLSVRNLLTGEVRELRPVYAILEDRSQQYIQNRVRDWNLTVTFIGMSVETGQISLGIEGVDVASEDWIVVQAYEKPFINLLWIGILLLSTGFCLALYRRVRDAASERGRAPTAA